MNEQEHILVCLMEECVEIAKDVSKSLRFGLEDRNVLNPTGPTNRERLIDELHDLSGVLEMLSDRGIIPDQRDEVKIQAKKRKVNEFMIYARNHGALQGEDKE